MVKREHPDWRIPYEHVNFVFVDNHYDYHLSGTCRVNGELCRFTTLRWKHKRGPTCHVFKLSRWEKVRWVLRQGTFELCVGYHWSYPRRTSGCHFYYRWPRWFWKLVFNAYYTILQHK